MCRMRTVRTSKYFTISNQTAQNQSLSFEALGLLTYCLSMPENWEFHPKVIWRQGRIGRDAVYKNFNELIKNYHCIRVKKPNPLAKGLPGVVEYEVFDEPEACKERIKVLSETEKFIESGDNFKECLRHPAFQDTKETDPKNQDLYKETLDKRNKERKEIPPPPEPPPPEKKIPKAEIPTTSSSGGGGGSLSFFNSQGKERQLTESDIYRYMLKYPQFSTETVMRAIYEARTPPNPVNDPFSYLVAICTRIHHSEKKVAEKLEQVHTVAEKQKPDHAPSVDIKKLMEKLKSK